MENIREIRFSYAIDDGGRNLIQLTLFCCWKYIKTKNTVARKAIYIRGEQFLFYCLHTNSCKKNTIFSSFKLLLLIKGIFRVFMLK